MPDTKNMRPGVISGALLYPHQRRCVYACGPRSSGLGEMYPRDSKEHMKADELRDWYTPSQAAHKLNLSRQYVTRLAEGAGIRAIEVGAHNPGGRPFWALHPEDVEAMARKRTQAHEGTKGEEDKDASEHRD